MISIRRPMACVLVLPGLVLSACMGLKADPARFADGPGDCPASVVTCVAIGPGSQGGERPAPVTFGQAFAPGDFPNGTGPVAVDGDGTLLASQIDRISRHADGSLRHAVMTVDPAPAVVHEDGWTVVGLRRMAAGEASSASAGKTAGPLGGYDLRVEVETFRRQISRITFGDRRGRTPGTPFRVGEVVTLEVEGERFTLKITPEMAGGDVGTLTRIAEAFRDLIARSDRFDAYKIGEGGGFERLWITPRAAPGQAFSVAVHYAGRARISVETVQNHAERRLYQASAPTALEAARVEGRLATWLAGPLATEYLVQAPLRDGSGIAHDHLSARFHIRAFAGRPEVRTDVVLENAWSYEPSPGNQTYDVRIIAGGVSRFSAHDITHYHHARWHRIVWTGGGAEPTVVPDTAYLRQSHAVPNYNPIGGASPDAVADTVAALARADTGPMGNAFINRYMPTSGDRGDIGPLPRWTALYLVSPHPGLRAVVLANGDAGATAPVHYRDRETDLPLSLDRHPWVALAHGKGRKGDAVPPLRAAVTPWTVDGAHQPSLAYVPYLLTGDLFYLEEVQFWASYNLGAVDPTYRDGGRGLLHANEVRGQAWTMRSLADAAYLTPDDHPMKGYFTEKLTNNLRWYRKNQVNRMSGAQTHGWMQGPWPRDPRMVGPWEDDFFAWMLADLVKRGFDDAWPVLEWKANFTVGRFVNEVLGFCPMRGAPYRLVVKDRRGQALPHWHDVASASFDDPAACPSNINGDPDLAGGYAAIARGALAMLADVGVPKAARAYRVVRDATPALDEAFRDDPRWAMIPDRMGKESRQAGSR